MPPFPFLSFSFISDSFLSFREECVCVCVCNCQKCTARRGEEMELKVKWVTTLATGHVLARPYILTSPNVGPGAPHLHSPFQDNPPRLFDMLIVAVGQFRAGKRAEAFRRLTRYKAANFKARFKGSVLIQQNKFAFLQCRRKSQQIKWNLKQWSRPNSEIRNQLMLSTWLLSVLRTLITSRWEHASD